MAPVAVRAERARLGRGPECEVVVNNHSVAPMHAELHRREGLWWLADLGSASGSWVDDEPLVGATPIAPGSTIRLGEAVLVFEPLATPEADRPVAPPESPVFDVQETSWVTEDEPDPTEPGESRPEWPRVLLWSVVSVGLVAGLVALYFYFVRVG